MAFISITAVPPDLKPYAVKVSPAPNLTTPWATLDLAWNLAMSGSDSDLSADEMAVP